MTVYVIREGKLVEKASFQEAEDEKRSIFPSPQAYRFKEYESPITGALITSPRQRERDLNNSGSIDPRDLPKGREPQRKDDAAGSTGQQQLDFWR